jgi:hypothetical protein
MKKGILTLLFFSISWMSYAQEGSKHFFQMAYAQPQFGGKSGNSASFGFGAGYTLGWNFRPSLGVGLGLGYEIAITRGQFWHIAPITLATRWLPVPKAKNNWYFSAETGYGYANQLINTNGVNFKSQGGFRFHPAVGIIWHTGKNKRWFTEVGYLQQNISNEQSFGDGYAYRQNLSLQRWVFRTGIAF